MNPDILLKRRRGLFQSLHVIQDGCSVCAHDDDIQLTLSFMFKSQAARQGEKFYLIESNQTLNRNQSNQSRKTLENSIDSITVRLIDQKRTGGAFTIAYVRFSKNFMANFVQAGYYI